MHTHFELRENSIFAAPTEDMCADKWAVIRPAVELSRYAEFLPDRGAGAREGTSNIKAIMFGNGTRVKFMSTKSKKGREGFTSRTVFITELEAFASPSKKPGRSRGNARKENPSPLAQIEKTTASYAKYGRRRIFGECTVGLETGLTWQEYLGGTASRLALPCPHCGKHVTLEREHLIGWDVADEIAAENSAAFVCPECGALWNNEQRKEANHHAVLLHRGQTMEGGVIKGPVPQTRTLGFRWNAANNLLWSIGNIAQAEWICKNRPEPKGGEEEAEKDICQSVWVTPYVPEKSEDDLGALDYRSIMERVDKELPRGMLAADAIAFTLGVDVHRRHLRWVALGWRPQGTPHVVDYGVEDVHSDQMDEGRAIGAALESLKARMDQGFDSAGGEWAGRKRRINLAMIDSGYQKTPVYQFCDRCGGGLWLASKAFGSTQKKYEKTFTRRASGELVRICEEYQVCPRPPDELGRPVPGLLVEINADYWKGWVHGRFRTPLGQPGAASLFRPEMQPDGKGGLRMDANCHLGYAKHLTSEYQLQEFIPGRGLVTRWYAKAINHYLDASAYACVAAHGVGVRLSGNEIIIGPGATAAPPAPAPRRQEERGRDDDRGAWMGERPTFR